jgi:hypothetical protein
MKVIVVSGARSNVGKTYLSLEICKLLPGAIHIKIGHHVRKPDDNNSYYNKETEFSVILSEQSSAGYLIIESNRILEKITPDCVIYLKADNPKPSAEIAIKKADIIRGEPVPDSKIAILAGRLECDEKIIRKIVELSNNHK